MDLKVKGKMKFLKDSKGEYVHNHKEEIDKLNFSNYKEDSSNWHLCPRFVRCLKSVSTLLSVFLWTSDSFLRPFYFFSPVLLHKQYQSY